MHIGIILYENNIPELQKFLYKWKKITQNYKNVHVRTSPSHDWAGQVPSDNILNSVRKENGLERNLLRSFCASPFNTLVISARGYVTPCCYDCNLNLCLGTILHKGNLEEIWIGKKAKSLREKMIKNRFTESDLCYHCHQYNPRLLSFLSKSFYRHTQLYRL